MAPRRFLHVGGFQSIPSLICLLLGIGSAAPAALGGVAQLSQNLGGSAFVNNLPLAQFGTQRLQPSHCGFQPIVAGKTSLATRASPLPRRDVTGVLSLKSVRVTPSKSEELCDT
eukprot:3745904-Rhodomonas_salina.1